MENLEKASQEELDGYMNKALKLKKTGLTMTIVGTIAFGASTAIIYAFDEQLGLGAIQFFALGIAGLGTMAIGIPMNLTGKSRVKRINTIKVTALYDVNINFKPCVQYNLAAQNYQPGIALIIRF